MQIEGTKAAFEALISERGIYKRLGVDRSTVATWKIYLRQGKSISLDKMEEILIKSGSTIIQEKVWDLDKISYEILADNMDDFYKELATCIIGDTIEANFSAIGNMDPTFTTNAIRRHAIKLNSSVMMDLSLNEMVTFKFIGK